MSTTMVAAIPAPGCVQAVIHCRRPNLARIQALKGPETSLRHVPPARRGASVTVTAMGAASTSGSMLGRQLELDLASYPPIDLGFEGLELIHVEPPVFVCHELLSKQDCDHIITAAEGERLPEVEYDNSALLDTQRLWPLAIVALSGAAFDSWQQAGLPAGGAPVDALLITALPNLAKWGAILEAMVAGAKALLPRFAGKVFTGALLFPPSLKLQLC
jgi:hypothetical protein